MVYASFSEVVEKVVKPLREQYQTDIDIQLSGQRTGGSREVVGNFIREGETWCVHADSHFGPLLLAYESSKAGIDPFVETRTPRGRCLVLRDDLSREHKSPFKHLYIYSWAKQTE